MTTGGVSWRHFFAGNVTVLTGFWMLAIAACASPRAGSGDGGQSHGGDDGSGGGAVPGTDGGPSLGGGGAPSASAWADWPMPNQPGGGLPNPQTYAVITVAGDEVVRDQITGLAWQRHPADSRFSWSEAMAHCDDLRLAGRDDWRLPSRIELVSLLNLTSTQPTIDPVAFPDTLPEGFWTASQDVAQDGNAWNVFFYFGYVDTSPKDTPFPARCVLGSAPASLSPPAEEPARYDLQGDTARDLRTGLTWQRAVPDATRSFLDAGETCAALTLGARDDWRLPSMQELETLVDQGRTAPAVDPAAFPDAPAEGFWSGTPWAGTPLLAWHTDFGRGNAAYDLGTMPYRVRCVRWGP